MLCAMRRRPAPKPSALCKTSRRIAVLENVMNPTNVGAIFRSAAALGMDAVLLTPGCSDPLYRRAIRVAMGTVFQIPWTYVDEDWPELLKINGFSTVAMALCPDSRALNDPEIAAQERLAIVLGTEGDGLAVSTIAACDYTVRIPMAHGVDSLNVAAASAVAFDLAEKHLQRPHPQSAVAVQFPVDDNRRARFGVVRHILHQIIVALEVSVDSF